MFKKNVLFAISLVVLLSFSLVAGGQQGGGVKVIKVGLWDETQKPSIERALEEFNASQDKIHAEVELTPWDNYWTKLDASLGAGTAPDVFWMNVYVAKYVDGNVLESLDSYIDKDGINLKNYVPGTTSIYNYKKQQWGMPKGMDSVAVAYNVELFKKYGIQEPEAGWTWEDMIAIADQFKGQMSNGEFPIVMELDAQPSYFNFIHQHGGFVVNDDNTKAGFDMKETKRSYQNVVDLMNNGQMAPYSILSETKGTDIFISGKAAIVFIGSWKASVMDESQMAKDGNLKLVTMPVNGKTNVSVQGGLGYSMFSESKNKEEAWEVIKFLTGEVSNRMQAEDGIDIPALISMQGAYKSNFSNIDVQAYFDASKTGVRFPFGPFGTQFFGDLNQVSSKIFNQDLTVEEGCNLIDENIEKVLDSN
jgi:multiple sugar transport system substrate-binding protein